ncbi:hypothetical protein [Rhodoplanes sp. Z2-YC6860]|uniref:hypothetical protein n=1 Tax=Rhodoplanes sp. Z2-YC6860 TaxID=674703 RepID=UPI0012EEC766|nr:hypothetical protein [Rhodoplanes sp. Z2-YC6860]
MLNVGVVRGAEVAAVADVAFREAEFGRRHFATANGAAVAFIATSLDRHLACVKIAAFHRRLGFSSRKGFPCEYRSLALQLWLQSLLPDA